MTTKELLQKTYECKTLEDLYTLLNGGVNPLLARGEDVVYYRRNQQRSAGLLATELEELDKANLIEVPFTIELLQTYSRWDSETHRHLGDQTVGLPETINKPYVYFGEDGEAYQTTINIVPKEGAIVRHESLYRNSKVKFYDESDAVLQIEKWKKMTRISAVDPTCLQSKRVLIDWYQKKNPYGYKWFTEDLRNRPENKDIYNPWSRRSRKFDLPFIMTHPELEQLSKMTFNGAVGLPLLQDLVTTHTTDSDRIMYERLFKPGTKASDIFVLPMNFIKVLWNKDDIKAWDSMRKMVQLRNCTIDDILQCENRRMRTDDYRKIDEVLRTKKLDGTPYFSFTTLLNYLGKIDVNEAIEREEGLVLIKDTIVMARAANQDANFDTDSLKRTHDVMMRNARVYRNEVTCQKILERCTKKYNFQSGDYFARQIESYEDLIDEGTQQQNCLRYCYADSIANGTTLIYVIRKVADPNHSLISVELSPDGSTVRQQFKAYNKPVIEKSQLDFIEKWNEYREEVNNKDFVC